MTTYLDELATLEMPEISPRGERLAFLGCGDSLSAALATVGDGHVAISAGDLAWTDRPLRGVETAVALSWSGRTGATVRAAERARDSGAALLAITANPDSPLAAMSEDTVILPFFRNDAPLPAIGFALHAAAVTGLTTGERVRFDRVAACVENWIAGVERFAADLPPVPSAITVASTPDMRIAGDLLSLKLIEATGLLSRSAPIEEIGHVDYFVGAQPHVSFVIAGEPTGVERAKRLAAALERNGHHVLVLAAFDIDGVQQLSAAERGIALGVISAEVAAVAAQEWRRTPFRGGAVDMSASHIQIH